MDTWPSQSLLAGNNLLQGIFLQYHNLIFQAVSEKILNDFYWRFTFMKPSALPNIAPIQVLIHIQISQLSLNLIEQTSSMIGL